MQPNQPNYGFIMQDPVQQPKSPLSSVGGGNRFGRAALIGGGLVLLLIIMMVVKNIVFPGPDFKGFVTIAQDQQEMIHLMDNAANQPSLTSSTQEFVYTTKLALTNDQQKTIEYLGTNNKKLGAKELNQKISTLTDSQLTSATSPGAYETALRRIMQERLNDYKGHLETAYKNFEGQKGRDLLDKNHTNAELLIIKLEQR